MSSFQGKVNIENIVAVCTQLLSDKHQIDISSNQLSPLVQQIVQYVSSHAQLSSLSLEEKNKRVIVLVRNYVLKNQPPPSQTTNVSASPVTQPSQTVQEAQTSSPIQEENPSEDTFFSKLEKLEIQRKVPMVFPQEASPALAPVAPVPTQVAQIQQPINQTIIMDHSSKKHRCVPIFVESIKRMWLYEPKRSSFIWNGVLPQHMDISNTRVLSVVMPYTHASILRLKIRGIGDQESVVMLQPSHMYDTWSYYVPFHENISYIRPLATPWTITLCDETDHEVSIGHDAWVIHNQAVKKYDLYETCLLFIKPYNHDGVIKHSFKKNDIIKIEGGENQECLCHIYDVHHDAIEVDKPPDIDGKNRTIVNLNQQVSIMLETQTLEKIEA